MTLEEAILDLASIPPWPNENDDPHYLDAIKLGIEAMKAHRLLCSPGSPHYPHVLPGETKE